MFNSVHYRYIFSDFSFDDTYMFVPIQFGINMKTKKFSNILEGARASTGLCVDIGSGVMI